DYHRIMDGEAATVMAVRNGRIALAYWKLNRLGTDGTTPGGTSGQADGLTLTGPTVALATVDRGSLHRGKTVYIPPRAAGLGPGGRWLYLTGYVFNQRYKASADIQGIQKFESYPGVYRVDMDSDDPPKVFAGVMKRGGTDTGPARLKTPVSVDCDSAGRVYVADYLNDRLQVFSPRAKLLKSIPVAKPIDLAIHHRTGEIYVFSWYFRNANLSRLQESLSKKRQRMEVAPKMVRLGPFADPKVRSTMALPLPGPHWGEFGHQGEFFDVALDSWTDPARIWITSRDRWRGWDPAGMLPRVYVERGGKLELVRSFIGDVVKRVGRVVPPRHGRCRTYVNPADGKLYVGESHTLNAKSFDDLVQIDPKTGRHRFVQLPFHSEDLAFDVTGRFYLRTENMVTRYRMVGPKLREVPFDYGAEADRVGYSPHSSGRFAKVVGGVELPSVKPGYWIMGGLAVSPTGLVAVACHNPGTDPSRRGEVVPGGAKGYKPRIYPGRPVDWEVHILDKHGRMLHADAIPGSRQLFGIGIDRDGDLYCMTPARRMLPDGKPYLNDASCAVFKVKSQAAKFVAASAKMPVPVGKARPDGPPHIQRGLYAGKAWMLGIEWLYGGVGNAAKYVGRAGGGCWCQYAQMTLDLFARTFVPEPDIYSVAVLDKAGNLITRIGRYGNPDDGLPLRKLTAWPNARSIGGDEVALFNPQHVATDTDHRLFISDIANGRIVSVKLGYHVTEKVPLAGVPKGGGGS
ncbi:hypothetical protein LCGC14_1873580, partial [marine sediment metagenome]